MKSVAVLDYGGSNLRSVAKALETVAGGAHQVIVSDAAQGILGADRVVFPGQGAIGDCMDRLRGLQLDATLHECVASKPFLGICLGLQTLMEESEEDGGTQGLGIFRGTVVRFPNDLTDPSTRGRLKIPHMGWNQVNLHSNHALLRGIASGTRFYFVHSYYVQPTAEVMVASTTYGVDFASAVARDNVFAVQFHPEKSQNAGLTLLSNFLKWNP